MFFLFDFCRYIEWIGCCCSGCNGGTEVKQESLIGKQFESLCRDVHFKHAISTKACQALQQFPSIMPLYSGYIFLICFYCFISSMSFLTF